MPGFRQKLLKRKSRKMFRSILAIALLLSASRAGAACTNDIVAGVYMASGQLVTRAATGEISKAMMQARFRLKRDGIVKVIKGVSSEGGNNVPWQGDGWYTLKPNCTGEMTLNLVVAGGISSRMNLDFLVQGSKNSPEIVASLVVHPEPTSGQLLLKKANF